MFLTQHIVSQNLHWYKDFLKYKYPVTAKVAVCPLGSYLRKVAVVLFYDWYFEHNVMVNMRPAEQRSYCYIAAPPT